MIEGYFENGKGDQNQHYLVYETSINQAIIGSEDYIFNYLFYYNL